MAGYRSSLRGNTYAVVLTPDGAGVNDLGTKECREALRERHGPITGTFDRGIDGRDV